MQQACKHNESGLNTEQCIQGAIDVTDVWWSQAFSWNGVMAAMLKVCLHFKNLTLSIDTYLL